MAKLKICIKCGKAKARGRFRSQRRTCWDCIRKYGSAWYRANRDRINEKRRRHYREHRDEILARWWSEAGSGRPSAPAKDRINEKRRRNYREHRVEICARERQKRNSPRPVGPYRTRLSVDRLS